MKWSPTVHAISGLAGVIGALALIAAWLVGPDGTFLNLSQAHLFDDAKALLLVSIAFGIGTLIHQNIER